MQSISAEGSETLNLYNHQGLQFSEVALQHHTIPHFFRGIDLWCHGLWQSVSDLQYCDLGIIWSYSALAEISKLWRLTTLLSLLSDTGFRHMSRRSSGLVAKKVQGVRQSPFTFQSAERSVQSDLQWSPKEPPEEFMVPRPGRPLDPLIVFYR